MPEGVGYNLIDRDGNPIHVSDADLASAIQAGATFETAEEGIARAGAQGRSELAEERYGGVGGAVEAGLQAGLRGATFGLSDVAQVALGDEGTAERLRGLEQVNPTISAVGEIGGAVVPALLSGGAGAAGSLARGTVAGKIAGVSTGIAARGAEAGLATKAATAIAGGALEGSAQNVGSYLSDVALGNKRLSAEAALGAGLDGALWGGGAGGALAVSEKAFTSARKLFAKADVTPEAVKGAERAAAAEVDSAIKDAGAIEEALTRKVRRARQARAEVDPVAAAQEAEIRAAKVAEAQAKAAAAQGRAELVGEQTGAAAARRKGAELRLSEQEAKAAAKAAKGAPAPVPEPVPAAPTPAPGSADDLLARLQATDERLAGGASIGDLNVERRGMSAMADDAIDDALDRAAAQADPEIARDLELRDAIRGSRENLSRTWLKDIRGKLGAGSVNVPSISPVSNAIEGAERGLVTALDDARGPRWTNTVTRKQYDAAGNVVENLPFDRAAWEAEGQAMAARGRPRPMDDVVESQATLDEYQALIKQAASETTDEARERLLAQAADLEAQAFDASPQDVVDNVIGARWATGQSGKSIAMSRMEREIKRLTKGGKRGKAAAAAVPEAQAVDLAEQIAATLRGGDDDLAENLADTIAGVSKHEELEREAVRSLGADAPPGSSKRALAYDDAAAARSEAQAASAAAQGDIVANATAGSQAADAATAAQVTGDAPAAKSGLGGMLADAATALEVMGSLGIPGLPRPDQLPVIGPMLGVVLKARAAIKVMGKLGGKVPATAEGEIARRAAATRDRMRQAVHDLLGGAAKGTRKIAPAAPIAAVLASKLFDDDPAPQRRKREISADDLSHLYLTRADELHRAMVPGAISKVVTERLNVADSEVRQHVVDVLTRKATFLASKLPGGGVLPEPLPNGDPPWVPDRARLETFARYTEAANDPAGVLERALGGELSLEGVETLQTVYPELFAEAQATLLSRMGEIKELVPYRQRVNLSALFKVPLDNTMSGDYLASMQAGYAAQPQPPAGQPGAPPPTPSISGPVTIGERSKLATDRISMR